MATREDLIAAMSEIDRVLGGFAGNGERPRVLVYETPYGHIKAVVGSDRFKGKTLGPRQELIWQELTRSTLERRHLGLLYGVRTLDTEEYDELMRQVDQHRLFEALRAQDAPLA